MKPILEREQILTHIEKRANELLSGGRALLTVRDEIRAGMHEVEDDNFITTHGLTTPD